MHNFYEMIKNENETYVIAELGSNHNGDIELAKKMIDEAKKAGADCVKFQSWTKDTIFSKKVYKENRFLKDDYRERTDFTMEEIVDKFSISEDELLEMRDYCEKVNIDFASTPFSKREADFLVDTLKAKFIKVASMDLNNYPFLEYIARKNVPVVLSTGLSELSEIDKAIRTIENCGNKEIIVLHCISIYPPNDEDVNLKNMDTLRTLYGYPIGFSDHTLGYSIPLAAIARGAQILEKHFTLDKNMFGWDHKISATPEVLTIICSEGKRIAKSIGVNRISAKEDIERKNSFRRSIVASRDIDLGETITKNDIDFKRPGDGLAPEYYILVVGRKSKRKISYDQQIMLEDIE